MSNIYIQEPPAAGKVLLKTTAGDIDLELWTKEAPKACRNFVQLCLEGYYNGTIFHRVVPDFIIQGGDPNGDGTGGESIYGAPFKDEFHSRLRFNRRGLVASANSGKDDNGSQFFFTLGATPELQNKHTIFGKVTGETIFNMLKLAEGETDCDDKPLYPKKIVSTEVLINPFTDIVPRKTTRDTREDAKTEVKKPSGVKNFGLLSFGEEAEEDEEETTVYKGKPKSTHDLLNDPKLSRLTSQDVDPTAQTSSAPSKEEEEATRAALSNIRDKLKGKGKMEAEKKEEEPEKDDSDGEYYLGKDRIEARKKQAEEIRGQIRDLRREMSGKKKKEAEEKEKETKEAEKVSNELVKEYEEEQDKYRKMKEKIPKKGASRKCRDQTQEQRKKPWVKNLYENKDYPDNYTDVKFLEQMKRNVNQQTVTFFQCFLGSCRVTQKLSTCVLFAVLFTYLYNDWISTRLVFSSSCIVNIVGYVLYLIMCHVFFSDANTNVDKKYVSEKRSTKIRRNSPSSADTRTKKFVDVNTKFDTKRKIIVTSSDSDDESDTDEDVDFNFEQHEENVINDIFEKNLKTYLKKRKKKEEQNKSKFRETKHKKRSLINRVYFNANNSISYHIFDDLKTVLIYLVFGYIVSPILHTLTDTVSTDTIFATTSIMMLIHLIFSDYGISVALVSNSLSINAAIFGSICLASRLSTSFHAFVLITVAVQCFFLFPMLMKCILQYSFALIIFLLTILAAFASLWFISKTIFYIFLITVLFLNVYCPYLFVRWQKYKDNIYGPWDEAVVCDSDDVDQCIGRKK